MAFIDHTAASAIRQLREDAGHNSAEALAGAIRAAAPRAAWGDRGTVDAWTIRMVEKGHVPGPRIRFVLASFFGRVPSEIWQAQNWTPVDVSVATAHRKVLA